MVPRLRIAGWATWAIASVSKRRMGCYFRRFQEIDVTRQRTDREDAFLHRNPAQLGQLADIDNEFG